MQAFFICCSHGWCHLLTFFSNYMYFLQTILSGTISKYLDPDQGRWSVSPGLGSKCLQRLSADYKSRPVFVIMVLPRKY